MLVGWSASAANTKRHSKASAALILDNIWGREIVRLEGEPAGEGGLLVIQHQACLHLYIRGERGGETRGAREETIQNL